MQMSRRAELWGSRRAGESAEPCPFMRQNAQSIVESSVPRDFVALHAETTICVWEMQHHICPSAVFRSPRET